MRVRNHPRRHRGGLRPVRALHPQGSAVLETLEDRSVPSLLGQQLFPADNPWNQKIAAAPVAANSAAIINNIISHYGDGRLHPDFGQDYADGSNPLYGIPYNVVHGNSTAQGPRRHRRLPRRERPPGRPDPGQRRPRGRLPERARRSAWTTAATRT